MTGTVRGSMSFATIVIPCYNEAHRLPVRQFEAFVSSERPYRLLFVNDGSTDGTLKLLESLRAYAPERFEVCDLPNNVGKAEAVRRGVLRAFDRSPTYVGYWDADLATPLETISTFCELLDTRSDIEMVFGARVRLLGRLVKRSPMRHYPGRLFATAASLTLGLGVYDTQCGAKIFRASPATRLLFQEPFSTRWLFDVEIIARLIQARRETKLPQAEDVIHECPLQEWHDVSGSKVKARDFAGAFIDLARIYRRYLRRRSPHRVNRIPNRKVEERTDYLPTK
jgi:dolichyl-phosphate beta-glucosyltransferase